MFPTNSTNLSLSGVLKWLAIILGGACLFIGGQTLVTGKTTGPNSMVVTGAEATHAGLMDLVRGVILLAVAFAIWRFWQSNED